VHAVDRHLFALFDLVERERVPRAALHALLDGRDTLPKSALGTWSRRSRAPLEEWWWESSAAATTAWIATSDGAHAALYDARSSVSDPSADPVAAIRDAYDRGETDEFIKPVVVAHDGSPIAPFRAGDALICFNYRSDRMRQMVRALTDDGFSGSRPGIRRSQWRR
jgi:2,3-bisphosphoglycerate-independent phosphoglycerate mutase